MYSVRHYGPIKIWHHGTKFCGLVNPSFGHPWHKKFPPPPPGTDVGVLWYSGMTRWQLAVCHWRFGRSVSLRNVGYPKTSRLRNALRWNNTLALTCVGGHTPGIRRPSTKPTLQRQVCKFPICPVFRTSTIWTLQALSKKSLHFGHR